jgi:FMN phosphatase YigB (HAD superfamily)
VGDSPEADVAGALASGLTAVHVARDGAPAAPGATRIEALDGLLSLLDG